MASCTQQICVRYTESSICVKKYHPFQTCFPHIKDPCNWQSLRIHCNETSNFPTNSDIGCTKFQWMSWYVDHTRWNFERFFGGLIQRSCISPFSFLQSGLPLVLLEELWQKPFVCTAWLSPRFSPEQRWLGFFSSELPLLEFQSALVTLSSQTRDLARQVRWRILNYLVLNRTSDLTRETCRRGFHWRTSRLRTSRMCFYFWFGCERQIRHQPHGARTYVLLSNVVWVHSLFASCRNFSHISVQSSTDGDPGFCSISTKGSDLPLNSLPSTIAGKWLQKCVVQILLFSKKRKNRKP